MIDVFVLLKYLQVTERCENSTRPQLILHKGKAEDEQMGGSFREETRVYSFEHTGPEVTPVESLCD